MRFTCCLLVLLCLLPVAAHAAPGPLNALVLADDTRAAAATLEAHGGQAYHLFDGALLGYVPSGLQVVGEGTIRQVVRRPVKWPKAAKPALAAALLAWNRTLGVEEALPQAPGWVPPPPPANDVRRVPHEAALGMRAYAPLGTDFYHTSDYMMGRVAVGIWLPESTGSAENWSPSRQATVVSKIQQACEWWRVRWPDANLSFVYEQNLSVPVTVEPIQVSSLNESTWINECLATKGFDTGDMWDRVYGYVNQLRDTQHSDWAFAVFVVDSLNDSDGMFPDTPSFAYSYLGGPFSVLTYDNDGYGIAYLNAVMAHEMGHLFWALDEYSGTSSPTERSGYLNVPNSNYVDGGSSNVPCIMRGQTEPYDVPAVCPFTLGQVGLRDTDGDHIPDILDVAPTCTLTPYSPDPSPDFTLTYTGTGQVGLLPNANSQDPIQPPPASSLNTISAVEYQVDGGAWQQATATDGAFDEGTEAYQFTVVLGNGTHTIQARARDNHGIYSALASDSVTITAAGPAPPSNLQAQVVSLSQVALTWTDNATNETGYVVDRQASGSSDWLRLATLPANAASYNDTTVTPGVYTYRVGATNATGTNYAQVVVNVATFADVPPTAPFWAYVEAVVREGITSGCSVTPRLYCPDSPVTRGQMAVFICRAAGIAPYDKPTPTFGDVPRTNPQYSYIEALYQAGITGGCSTSPLLYCPNAAVTRGQMAVFLCRAAGIAPYNKPTPTFSDVPKTNPQYSYIEALYQAGITGGCSTSPRLYCPNAAVTRGQMAVFLCRAFAIPL